jgi:AhpD family alkylhydroperoxidase
MSPPATSGARDVPAAAGTFLYDKRASWPLTVPLVKKGTDSAGAAPDAYSQNGLGLRSLPSGLVTRYPVLGTRLLLVVFSVMSERREPTYKFTEQQVAARSPLARNFIETRQKLNANVDKADNYLVKRFYNLDHNTYLEGAIPARYKELMGLVVSAGLRCDDCINYHIIQSYRLEATRAEQEEALNVALIVGGSIVIPHLRRAYALLEELYG